MFSLCACLVIQCVWLFATPWTMAHQAPLSLGILQARILEWVAISFSRGSFQPRDWTWVSCLASGFFTTEPPGKPHYNGRPIIMQQKQWKPLKYIWAVCGRLASLFPNRFFLLGRIHLGWNHLISNWGCHQLLPSQGQRALSPALWVFPPWVR